MMTLSGSIRINKLMGSNAGSSSPIIGATTRAKPIPVVPWMRAPTATAIAMKQNDSMGIVFRALLGGEFVVSGLQGLD